MATRAKALFSAEDGAAVDKAARDAGLSDAEFVRRATLEATRPRFSRWVRNVAFLFMVIAGLFSAVCALVEYDGGHYFAALSDILLATLMLELAHRDAQ
jgi:hypothetical protein